MPDNWIDETVAILEENLALYHKVNPDWYRRLYSKPLVTPSLLTESEIHQLVQLIVVTWDGNLISKDARNKLIDRGYVQRLEGWNWLTELGVKALVDSGFLHA
jgi:hypothetical protein